MGAFQKTATTGGESCYWVELSQNCSQKLPLVWEFLVGNPDDSYLVGNHDGAVNNLSGRQILLSSRRHRCRQSLQHRPLQHSNRSVPRNVPPDAGHQSPDRQRAAPIQHHGRQQRPLMQSKRTRRRMSPRSIHTTHFRRYSTCTLFAATSTTFELSSRQLESPNPFARAEPPAACPDHFGLLSGLKVSSSSIYPRRLAPKLTFCSAASLPDHFRSCSLTASISDRRLSNRAQSPRLQILGCQTCQPRRAPIPAKQINAQLPTALLVASTHHNEVLRLAR